MGASDSKPIKQFSKEEVSLALANLGDCYQPYCDNLVQNGIDGPFLDNLSNAHIEETLDFLNISHRLHRRVLTKELHKARASQDFVARSYDYSPSTPDSDLEPYYQITERCFRENLQTAALAGVHLVLENGNQLSLDTKILKDGTIVTNKLHRNRASSLCGTIVNDGSNQTYYKLHLSREIQKALFDDLSTPITYTGYILKDEPGRRIGLVCMLDRCSESELVDTKREAFLKQLASDVEHHLRLRKQFIERRRSQQHRSNDDVFQTDKKEEPSREIVLPAHGPLRPVLKSQVKQRMSQVNPFHFIPSGERASHNLPIFQNMSTEAQRAHLPLDFFELVDEIACPRPPIANNDMECSAVVEALRLTDINPEDSIAIHLKEMVKMAAQVFGFPNAEITFRTRDTMFCIAGYGVNDEIKKAASIFPTIKNNKDGSRFLWKMPRAAAVCNYALASARSFVVQDIAADESFQWLISGTPVRCYVGTAIKDSCGRAIAVLCMHDAKPRPDFEAAHEIQLEQLACLISQSIENWALKRSVERLEKDRKVINRGRDKQRLPKDNITLVLTDIEGCMDMWEANISAMQIGRSLHDQIIKEQCSKHFGHEVGAEGHSFALAFHDPVDAFAFALQTQLALNEANWSEDLLRLPGAREEVGAFRGLRVKMAIHEGNIHPNRDDESEQSGSTGETMNIAESLLQMARGGQILATSETWDIASYFIGSMLSFPQVLDHGSHVLRKGETTRDGVITKRIIQLVPSKLAYDYFAARKLSSGPQQDRPNCSDSNHFTGRHFPPISSLKKVSPSFHDAPFVGNEVTIAFLNLSRVSDDEASSVVNLIGILLDGMPEFGGYQCQSEMLAFHRPLDAVLFGLRLQKEVAKRQPQGGGLDGSYVSKHISYACIHEPFLTMGPHRTTGRADYFGKIVNRAARLSKVVATGSVCLGVVNGVEESDPAVEMEKVNDPIAHPSVKCQFCGRKRLKGVPEEVAVYECKLRSDSCSD